MVNPLMQHKVTPRTVIFVNGRRFDPPTRSRFTHRLRVLWNRYNLVVYAAMITLGLVALFALNARHAAAQIRGACERADAQMEGTVSEW
jgi:hypothetical protein